MWLQKAILAPLGHGMLADVTLLRGPRPSSAAGSSQADGVVQSGAYRAGRKRWNGDLPALHVLPHQTQWRAPASAAGCMKLNASVRPVLMVTRGGFCGLSALMLAQVEKADLHTSVAVGARQRCARIWTLVGTLDTTPCVDTLVKSTCGLWLASIGSRAKEETQVC